MGLAFELNEEILQNVVAVQMIKGELGDKVARELALIHAEVVTYNRTGAAELLRIGRNTLSDYEKSGQVSFDADGRISLLALLEFRRTLSVREDEDQDEFEINRKSKPEGKRQVKNR
jgi:hypothetical protein